MNDQSYGRGYNTVIGSRLGVYEPPAARWREWQRHEPVLDVFDFTGLRQALLDRDNSGDRKDELLAALIRLGQGRVDVDAKTAVVVCLLPGLRRIVGRYQDILRPHDAWAEVLTALWEHLGKYDLDRRPRRVAANLLWDSTNRLVRTVRLERSWLNHVDLGSRAEDPDAGFSPADPSVLQTAIVAGVLAPFDATLIEATRLNGISLADAAKLLGISYEAAKKRRQRAEATWVDWWAPELRPTLAASVDTSSATRAA